MANVDWNQVISSIIVTFILFGILGAFMFAIGMAISRPKNPKEAEFPAIVNFGLIGGFIVITLIVIFVQVLGGEYSVIKKFNTKFGPTIYGNNPRL